MLSREQIAQARDFSTSTVHIPEWGGTVLLRSMTVGCMDDIQIRYLRLAGPEAASADNGAATSLLHRHPELLREMKSRLLSYCICDESGALLFDDDEGRAILERRNPLVIDRLYEVASQLNRLGAADLEEEKKASGSPPMPGSN